MGHAQWDTRDQGLPLPARGVFSLSLCIWVSLTIFPMGCLHAGLSLNLSSSLGFSPFLPVGLCLSGHLFTCLCSPGLGAGNDLSVLQVHPHHHGAYPQLPHWPPSPPVASAPVRPGPRPHPPLLIPRTFPSCTWTGSWRTPPTSWASPCSTPHIPSTLSLCEASTCPGGRTAKPAPTRALR